MEGGLFVTLYGKKSDQETLKLYLDRGVYGQLMTPQEDTPPPQSSHYPTLADYACARDGRHVFFFQGRRIYYGGQITGAEDQGAFYLNGQNNPMGVSAKAPLVWDESDRERYKSSETDGVFLVETSRNKSKKCQPFLIQFEDKLNLAGNHITSDQFYFKLGEYPYPLPSNSISGMGFCTLTPGETNILLDLLKNEPEGNVDPASGEDIRLDGDPLPYKAEYSINEPSEASYESHLEASLIANPNLLPSEMKPKSSIICRQVPISPFKPSQMDRADICYYDEESLKNKTIPSTVIELKLRRSKGKLQKAGKNDALQINRYLKWLHKRLGRGAEDIKMYILAPDFAKTFGKHISSVFEKQIRKRTYS